MEEHLPSIVIGIGVLLALFMFVMAVNLADIYQRIEELESDKLTRRTGRASRGRETKNTST